MSVCLTSCAVRAHSQRHEGIRSSGCVEPRSRKKMSVCRRSSSASAERTRRKARTRSSVHSRTDSSASASALPDISHDTLSQLELLLESVHHSAAGTTIAATYLIRLKGQGTGIADAFGLAPMPPIIASWRMTRTVAA